jgi:hypothetical protein
MPPSSPSEQALTRRENEDNNQSHALRSASRSTRRVANRRAPKQESEASGHGHPSNAGSPTIPRSKASRGQRTTSGRVGKRATTTTIKAKSGQTLLERDGSSKNILMNSRQERSSSANRHHILQGHMGAVESSQTLKEESVIAQNDQSSVWVKPGVPLRTMSIPSKNRAKSLNRDAGALKGQVMTNRLCNASSISSTVKKSQDQSGEAWDSVVKGTRSELSTGRSQTHSFPSLTLSTNLLKAGSESTAQAQMQFTAPQVSTQLAPLQHEYSMSLSMSTSPTSSTHTSNQSIYTPASSLAIPESTQTFKANILPGFSSARLADPSSSSVLARRASSISLSPKISSKSQRRFNSPNPGSSSSCSTLMD